MNTAHNTRSTNGHETHDTRRTLRRRGAAALLVAIVVATFALAATMSVGAYNGTQTITLDPDVPVAWEPMTVTVDRDDCTPDAPATTGLWYGRDHTGAMTFITEVDTTVDGDGRLSVDVSVPSAYPGIWTVNSWCDGDWDWTKQAETDFEVALPESFTMGVAAAGLRVGEPFHLEISGAGCPGQQANWGLVGADVRTHSRGTVDVAADGTWTVVIDDVIPADWPVDTLGVMGNCVVGQGPYGDDIRVDYPEQVFQVLPAVAKAVVSTPRLTG